MAMKKGSKKEGQSSRREERKKQVAQRFL